MYLFDFCGCTDDVTYVRCGAVLETAEARASAATAHSTEQSATQLNKEIPIIKFNPFPHGIGAPLGRQTRPEAAHTAPEVPW